MPNADPSTLLEQLLAAAKERQLASTTLAAYLRAWTKLLTHCAVESLDPGALSRDKAKELYQQMTRKRSASHHLQVKAALSFLYRLLDQTNPFSDCLAPRFRAEATDMQFLEAEQTAQVLLVLREASSDYFGHLAAHLAEALFFTACRFHEWATLPAGKLIHENDGSFTAARLKVKGGKFRDVPLVPKLSESLQEWHSFLESYRGVRLRKGAVEFAKNGLVFPGRDGTPISNQAFNRRLATACRAAGVPIITAHGLRHSAANLLLNDKGRNLRELQELLGHRSMATTARYRHIDRERLRGVVAELEFDF